MQGLDGPGGGIGETWDDDVVVVVDDGQESTPTTDERQQEESKGAAREAPVPFLADKKVRESWRALKGSERASERVTGMDPHQPWSTPWE